MCGRSTNSLEVEMDYAASNIGLRVDETAKQFCVIVMNGGQWRELGQTHIYPAIPPAPTLGSARNSADVAFLVLENENPSAANEFKSIVYPR